MKRLLSIILILTIILIPIISAAEGEMTIGELSEELQKNFVISLLIAGGLQFATQSDALFIADNFMLNYNSLVAGTIVADTMISTAGDVLWDTIKLYISQNFDAGDNISYSENNQIWNEYPQSPVLTSNYPYQVIWKNGTGAIYLAVGDQVLWRTSNCLWYNKNTIWYQKSGTSWSQILTRTNGPNSLSMGTAPCIILATNFDMNLDNIITNKTHDNYMYNIYGTSTVDNPYFNWFNPTTLKRDILIPYHNPYYMTQDEVINQTMPLIPPTIPTFPESPPEGSEGWLTTLWNMLKSIFDFLGHLATSLINGIGELIKALFIPEEGFFQDSFTNVKQQFDNKFLIIEQLNTFFNSVKEVSYTATPPTFEVNLEHYGAGTQPIIDLTWYNQYRNYLLNFIRFIMWFIFLKKVFRRLPSIIYQ